MPINQKKEFVEILHNMAIADGYADETEINFIIGLIEQLGLTNDSARIENSIDFSFIMFEADKQYIYHEGFEGERKVKNIPVTIKVEAIPDFSNEYLYTIFEKSQDAALWGINVIYPTHRIKLISENELKIVMEAVENGPSEIIELHHDGNSINKITFQNEFRGIYTEYIS